MSSQMERISPVKFGNIAAVANAAVKDLNSFLLSHNHIASHEAMITKIDYVWKVLENMDACWWTIENLKTINQIGSRVTRGQIKSKIVNHFNKVVIDPNHKLCYLTDSEVKIFVNNDELAANQILTKIIEMIKNYYKNNVLSDVNIEFEAPKNMNCVSLRIIDRIDYLINQIHEISNSHSSLLGNSNDIDTKIDELIANINVRNDDLKQSKIYIDIEANTSKTPNTQNAENTENLSSNNDDTGSEDSVSDNETLFGTFNALTTLSRLNDINNAESESMDDLDTDPEMPSLKTDTEDEEWERLVREDMNSEFESTTSDPFGNDSDSDGMDIDENDRKL